MVERAALLASGGDFAAAMAWITDHAGVAEATVPQATRMGLHGARIGSSGGLDRPRTPLRFVLPAGASELARWGPPPARRAVTALLTPGRRRSWPTCKQRSQKPTTKDLNNMASSGKKKTTMAKLMRESRLRERRQDKQAKKDARKLAPAPDPDALDGSLGDPLSDPLNRSLDAPLGDPVDGAGQQLAGAGAE